MQGRGGDGRPLSKNDNEGEDDGDKPTSRLDNSATKALRSIIERVERLEEEKRGLTDDIGEILKEAKASGFDPKVIRFIIRERRKDPDDVEEFDNLVEVYRHALEDDL